MTNLSKDVKLLLSPLVVPLTLQLRLSLTYHLLYIHAQSRWPDKQLFMESVLLMSRIYMVLHSLKPFVIHFQYPQLPRHQVEHQASKSHIPFQKLLIFHCIKYVSQDPFSINPHADIVVDSIHCEPARHDKYGNIIPGRFDTTIINHKDSGKTGVKGQN